MLNDVKNRITQAALADAIGETIVMALCLVGLILMVIL